MNHSPSAASVRYRRDGVEVTHPRRNPVEFLRAPYVHRELLRELVKRDVAGRYRGSALGFFWSFLQPLTMLAAYTVVFGVFLKTRWTGATDSLHYSVVLFAGLIVFNFVAECITRGPALIVSHPNYVKKVVFPLELLPWVVSITALLHTLVSIGVWSLWTVLVLGRIPASIAYLPIVLVAPWFLGLGACFLMSAAGVYFRDVGQITTILLQVLLFLSPIFYTIAAIPPEFRIVLLLNPLTFIVEQARAVMLDGGSPNLWMIALYTLGSAAFAALAFAWFQRLREGFADVL